MKKKSIEEFARQTLKDHDMYSIPVDPVVLANKMGIRVSNAVFSDPSLSGMIAKRGNHSSILVKDDDALNRKKFTIAHELGHMLLHLKVEDGEFIDKADYFRTEFFKATEMNENKGQEVEANQFAAALLMDSELIKQCWPEIQSSDSMADLFKVSKEAMEYRLNHLGLI
jgi:Zn-dependent peptidase ImmA (M78 family)